jgi:hypothetical protein
VRGASSTSSTMKLYIEAYGSLDDCLSTWDIEFSGFSWWVIGMMVIGGVIVIGVPLCIGICFFCGVLCFRGRRESYSTKNDENNTTLQQPQVFIQQTQPIGSITFYQSPYGQQHSYGQYIPPLYSFSIQASQITGVREWTQKM